MSQGVFQFRVQGLDCADEVAQLRGALGPMVGGEEHLAFDLVNRRLTVTSGDLAITSAAIVSAVAAIGMRAEPWTAVADEKSGAGPESSIGWTIASGTSLAIAMVAHGAVNWNLLSATVEPFVTLPSLALSILCGLRLVAPKALRAARQARPDMNLLMVVAVLGAIGIREHFEAASVAFLFALAESLEGWSVRRAHRAIAALLDVSPPMANVVGPNGQESSVPVTAVAIGSRIVVKPGERIPLDGVVVAGASLVNQAPITGESLPVGKQPGDTVFAATVNGSGALEVESTRTADNTTVAQIVRLVQEAQSQRAPSEKWVSTFAAWYTPLVMAASMVVFVIPPLLLGQNWSVWFYRSLALLVIACPCALVISTPVSILAALACAARRGVLIKGGAFVEVPASLRAIAFDKTGTLTEGAPSVRAVLPWNGHSETEVLERAAALESRSEHPLAKAILDHARRAGVSVRSVEDYRAIPGKGATGLQDGETWWLGSARLLSERGQETPEIAIQIAEFAERGWTVVIVGDANHACGMLGLSDTVRPAARTALSQLRAVGVRRLVMLTGDTTSTANAIGRDLGLDEWQGDLLPADKVSAVEKLVAEVGVVAMVGDGVNDAPALARASLGIAMGAAGSDAAIETADVALMSNDLGNLAWLVVLSRRTMAIVRQNIWFSLVVKAVFVCLAMVGWSTLWGAIFADTGASLLVILNGLRLLRDHDVVGAPIRSTGNGAERASVNVAMKGPHP